jgi:urease accessory protein
MQLADSAYPIGAAAHSLGLETLTAEGFLAPAQLGDFLRDYLSEIGAQEGLFCRLTHQMYSAASFDADWLNLNRRISALKLGRESRKASAMMGKRFLQMACNLHSDLILHQAYALPVEAHHAAAFGLVGSSLGIDEGTTVAIYLQQCTQSLISAFQRLLPLGQTQAVELLWRLKPAILSAAQRSTDPEAASYCFPGLVEMAAMRHAALPMRLFIS